jgi:phage terminase large subunit
MARQIQVTRVYERNLDSEKPIVVNVGGARSTKSYSILQLLLQKFVSEPRKTILIARKTLPSLRLTAYGVFINLLKDYGYYQYCTHNKTDRTIKYRIDPGDESCTTTVYFLSIDDPEKIKSTEFNYAFLEEANEFTFNDFFITWTRMSGATPENQPNKLFLALNPNDEFSWINQKLPKWDDVEFIHSTYKDNPFLSKKYIKILEDLEFIDDALYQIYALGKWAQLPDIIYRNYVEAPCDGIFDEIWYGLDFGFNHPTALVQMGMRGGELYVKELIYKSHMTNRDLIDEMGRLEIDTRSPMYADSAEPLLKERMTYKWMTDKNGNTLDKPVKFNDDCMDAMRYGIYTHLIDDDKPDAYTPRGH